MTDISQREFEDGVYVSFASDDTEKIKAPESVVVIKNAKVTLYANPNAAATSKKYLDRLQSLMNDNGNTPYDSTIEIALYRMFEYNGYSPKPSDYFDLNSPRGEKYVDLAKDW